MTDQIIPENIAKLMQIALNLYLELEPPLVIDGVIGPATLDALRQAVDEAT